MSQTNGGYTCSAVKWMVFYIQCMLNIQYEDGEYELWDVNTLGAGRYDF